MQPLDSWALGLNLRQKLGLEVDTLAKKYADAIFVYE